ncbi:MAG: hypothetical protein GC150_15515 [Rhizobiales bacterium]|nr:hypothetical protein [Hyphomicrobiales bacterium]
MSKVAANESTNPSMQLYLLGWCALAIGAIGYIAFLAIGEDKLSDRLPISGARPQALDTTQLTEQARATERAIATISENVESLKRTVAEVRRETVAVRQDVTTLQAWRTEIEQVLPQVASTEISGTDGTDSPTPAAATTPQVVVGVPDAPGQGPAATAEIEGVTFPAGGGTPEIVSSQEIASSLQVSAPSLIVAPPQATAPAQPVAGVTPVAAPPPPPPVVPLPDRGTYGVELARGPNIEAIRLSWDLLNERHSQLFQGLGTRYLASNNGGANPYRLIAGPFRNKTEAVNLCARLATVSLACRPTAFGGSLL